MTDKEALDWLIPRKEHYEMDDDCQELAEAINIGIDAIKQKMKKKEEMKMGHWIFDEEFTLDEVCMEYKECTEECPAYKFCHSKKGIKL